MSDLASWLREAGIQRGDLVGLAVAPDGTAAVWAAPGATTPGTAASDGGMLTAIEAVGAADDTLRPRWVTWSQETAQRLVAGGVRIATCWDVAAVHRLIFGGFRADPAWAWAHLNELPLDAVPASDVGASEPLDLFSALGAVEAGGDSGTHRDDGLDGNGGERGGGSGADGPVEANGQLSPEWTHGGWASPDRLAEWACLALRAAELQRARIEGEKTGGRAIATGRSESTAELLCAELAADGLPVALTAVEDLLASIIGPRPRDEREAAAIRAARDAEVLKHAPPSTDPNAGQRAGRQAVRGTGRDLRSPLQVKELLAAAGIDVPDTRAWRLEPLKATNELVAALLEWRKAERIATTYGYSWLDACLGQDGRLRGAWTGADGAAGRMTASAGLHNMPAVLRKAVLAEPGHLFVRADLGQIEPRVLAAVSGDKALAAATAADDLYLPVAEALGVDRPTAKVAMIAAMYGQTTGHGGEAAKRMRQAYPVAMRYLDDGDRAARNGHDLRTYGGRLVRMTSGGTQAQVAGRGRYGRNALIQGAAAELFKMWAVTVRSRGLPLGARIVLCLHDELLVHVPEEHAGAAAALVGDCLNETSRWWAPPGAPREAVRFIADISVIRCWADAKA